MLFVPLQSFLVCHVWFKTNQDFLTVFSLYMLNAYVLFTKQDPEDSLVLQHFLVHKVLT